MTTRATERIRVNCTSWTEARMVCVRSSSVSTCTLGGIAATSRGSRALIASTVSRMFAPGCLKITRMTPRCPFW